MPSPLEDGDKILIGYNCADGCILGNMTDNVKQVKHYVFISNFPCMQITETKPEHHYTIQHVDITWQIWLDQDLAKLNLVYDLIYKVGAEKELILMGGKRGC